MIRRTIVALAVVLVPACLSVDSLEASIIPNTIPIPSSEVLSFSGLEWVYAGPVAPNEFGPGQIELPSYRASEGWRFATAAEWAVKPDWEDFVKAPFAVPADVQAIATWTDHSKYKFTSEYWSNFSHVDLNDADAGLITNGFDIGSLTNVWETFYVRTPAGGVVPEPTTLLVWSLLLGLAATLKRRQLRKPIDC